MSWSIATIGYLVVHRRLDAQSGLTSRSSAEGTGSEVQEPTPAGMPSTGAVRSAARLFGGRPFEIEWRGVLLPASEDRYRFLIEADDEAELFIDGRMVASERLASGGAAILLDRRQHDVLIRYADRGGDQRLSVSWARGGEHFRPVPALLLAPARIPLRDVDRRRVTMRAALPLTLGWVLFLVAIAGAAVRAVRPHLDLASRPEAGPMRARNAALVTAAVLFALGISWGLPGPASWAPDEIGPIDVWSGLQARFANGWSSIYPPFHHALIAIFYLPFEAAFAWGIGDREDVVWSGVLLLIARAISVCMAAGIVWAAHRIALEQFGPRAAALAAWITLAVFPLSFYAKTANLDVPYVFWMLLSFVFFGRTYSVNPRASDFYLFTVFAALAVCTKDQAYGFYVLPGIYMLVGGLLGLRRPGVPPRAVLGRMIGLALLAFAILHNLPFNRDGFAEHVRAIVGPGSSGFQMFANTVAGHLRMAGAAFVQVGQAMSWPVFAAAVISVGAAVASRATPVLWLLLPCVSYYLTFISIVRYHYDRFFLGVAVVLAIVAAWGVDRLLARSRPRGWQMAVLPMMLTYAIARPLALDLMMMREPRYRAEQWLRANVAPEHHVVAIGHGSLLPRSSLVPWTPMRPNLTLLADERPEFVIVPVGFSLRSQEGSQAQEFYTALASGASDYNRAARFRNAPLLPLSWESRFRRVEHDPFTNLSKVGSAIDVYVRKDVSVGR